jgi:putative Ca2+/H+ antiporter (TMEM165/GDT1 family)
MDFWGKYNLRMLTPIVLFVAICLALGIRHLIGVKFPRWALQTKKSIKNHIFAVLSFLIIGLFTFCISSVFQPFNCVKQNNESMTLSKYPSVVCFDKEWMSHLGSVVFFIIVYCFVVPGFLIFQFFVNRKNVDSPEFFQKFPNLLSPYRRRHFYFELVFMLRKALFVVANDFLPITADYNVRILVTIFLLWLYMLMDILIAPYQKYEMNLLESR